MGNMKVSKEKWVTNKHMLNPSESESGNWPSNFRFNSLSTAPEKESDLPVIVRDGTEGRGQALIATLRDHVRK